MAQKYGVSPAALCVRYTLQLGAVSLPKTVNPAHMADNAAVGFTISDEDMQSLIAMTDIDCGADGKFPVFS